MFNESEFTRSSLKLKEFGKLFLTPIEIIREISIRTVQDPKVPMQNFLAFQPQTERATLEPDGPITKTFPGFSV